MLRHTLLLIYRNFKRFKTTFFINLIGLSIGLASALLIYLWVADEFSFDRFHEKDDQLFQVMMKTENPEFGIQVIGHPPGPLAQALSEEMPEVEFSISVITSWAQGVISNGDKNLRASENYVSKDFFNVFSYKLIEGNKDLALTDKNNILISDELAKKLFNTTKNIIGNSVEWNKEKFGGTYFISGIFEKPPFNSSAQFDLLFSSELYFKKDQNLKLWTNGGAHTYLILKKGTNVAHFNEKIQDFLQKKNSDKYWSIFIKPYSDNYLYGKYENGVQARGRIEYVKLFSIIGFAILIIACINFMNLSTAKASRRIKEIGIKKAIGADRKALIFQYLGESMLMSFLSLIIAVLLVDLFLPQFNEITGKQLRLNFDSNLMLSVFGITLITGLLSGSYPALYLSEFGPAMVLKGKLNTSPKGRGESWARKGLVIFQFTISVILIASVLVIYKQIEFIQSKNLGYNQDNIILFKKEGKLEGSLETFLQEMKSLPGIVNASSMQGNMTAGGNKTAGLIWEGKNPEDLTVFGQVNINYDLIETLDIEMKEGRSFSRNFGSDTSKVILNEAAVESMGLKDPLGTVIKYWKWDLQVVGVVKNFHFESLYKPMIPSFMVLRDGDNVVAKIKAGMERETIDQIHKLYNKYNPGLPFDYKFLDETYQAFYASEQRVAKLSRYFAGIAILISCLGLFGLAAFTAERRLKEIGIRKVLGANALGIVYLLSSDFTKIVFASIVISLPISYFITKNWLESFAFKIELEWWYFIGAGLMALFIAWLTVGTQAFKAARINPTKCLRDE